MTGSAVLDEAGWIDTENRAPVDSTISDQWRAFLKDVMSAHIGVGVTQKMWRRILPVFWRLPAWGWSPAIQSPPPDLAMFRTAKSLLSGGLHQYQSADGTRKELIPVHYSEEHRK